MNSIKKTFHKKFFVAALLAAIVAASLPGITMAQTTPAKPDLLNCLSEPATCAMAYLAWAMNAFVSLLISAGAWLIDYVLNFSRDVVNMAVVQMGFGVSLSIANLGFVLGIIVIALATILRLQSYGIKQILWKLVVAAIMVNFGLVIAGVILNFSETLTKAFMPPAGTDYGTSLMNAYGAPNFKVPPQPANNTSYNGTDCNQNINLGEFYVAADCTAASVAANQVNAVGTDPFTDFARELMAAVFGVIFQFIIAFSLFALAIMLFIRFAFIAILLILMPLAWLMWIFPNFRHLFSRWWSLFLKWTFFPAITMFFLFLATKTVTNTAGASLQNAAVSLAQNPAANIGIQTNDPGLLSAMAQCVLMAGLALGGLFAANSLSIMGASVAMGTLKSVGNAAQGYVGKQGKRGIARIVPTKVQNALQEGRIPIRGTKKLQMLAGVGLGKIRKAGTADLVEGAAKAAQARAKNPEEAARLLASGGLNRQDEIALIKELTKDENLGYVKRIRGTDRDKYIADNEQLFKVDYGQVKLYEKELKTALMNPQAQPLAAAVAQNPAGTMPDVNNLMGNGANQLAKTIDLLNASMKQLVLKQDKSDANNIDTNHLLKTETLSDPTIKTRVEAYLRAVASYNHELVPGMLNGMKAEPRRNFAVYYKKAIQDARDEARKMPAPTPQEKQEQREILTRLAATQKSFDKILLNNAFYASGGAPEAGAPPSPATPV